MRDLTILLAFVLGWLAGHLELPRLTPAQIRRAIAFRLEARRHRRGRHGGYVLEPTEAGFPAWCEWCEREVPAAEGC